MAQMGRPKVDHPKAIRFSIRIDAVLDKRLKEYCAKNNTTKGEAIRQGIELLLSAK